MATIERKGVFKYVDSSGNTVSLIPEIPTDTSLKVSGSPADAKAVGDALAVLDDKIENFEIPDTSGDSTSNIKYDDVNDKILVSVNGDWVTTKLVTGITNLVIYDNGEIVTPIDYKGYTYTGYTNITPVFQDTQISVTTTAGTKYMFNAGTDETIDLTDYAYFKAIVKNNTKQFTISLDISALSGYYYPSINMWGSTNSLSVIRLAITNIKTGLASSVVAQTQITPAGYQVYITKMWLEK